MTLLLQGACAARGDWMHPALIKAALEIAGYTQMDIADDCEVSSTSVREVIHGKSRSAKIESQIAKVLDTTPQALWPDWYGPNGNSIRRRRSRRPTNNSIERLIAAAASAGIQVK